MGQILRNWRITLAAFLSVVAIGGSFLLARDTGSPNTAEASAESALLQAIAARDSDGDGLADWEEALYGADSHLTDTFKLGMTDGEAVAKGLVIPKAIADIPITTSSPAPADQDGLPPPAAEGTLTDTFAKNFFTLYLSVKQANGGEDLSEADTANIANEALASLSSAIAAAPDFKSAKDITVSGSGLDALKTYAVEAETVLRRNTTNATKSEVLYLQDTIQKEDTTAIPYIVSISKGYRNSAAGLAALSVPEELVTNHLLLVNAMMRVSQITADFARVNDDPLATMLALQQYPQAVLALGTAFVNIGTIYRAAGVSLPAGTPGASFVNLAEDIAPAP